MSAEKARNFGNCFWRSSSSSRSTIALPAWRLLHSHHLCARATKKDTRPHAQGAHREGERMRERVKAHRRQEREYLAIPPQCAQTG